MVTLQSQSFSNLKDLARAIHVEEFIEPDLMCAKGHEHLVTAVDSNQTEIRLIQTKPVVQSQKNTVTLGFQNTYGI